MDWWKPTLLKFSRPFHEKVQFVLEKQFTKYTCPCSKFDQQLLFSGKPGDGIPMNDASGVDTT